MRHFDDKFGGLFPQPGFIPSTVFYPLIRVSCFIPTTSWRSGRVLAFCVGGPGFKPRLGHTKDFLKMVPNAALLGAQQKGVGFGK